MPSSVAPPTPGRAARVCLRALIVLALLVAVAQLASFAWALYWRARFPMDL
ncbi:MAG: hypothetical protein ACRELB_04495 [Polyangiaceae bacterium]